VKGLKDFPKEDRPPVLLPFINFHSMVGLGMYFIGLTALGLFLLWRKRLYENKLFLLAAFVSIPLPFISNELGWIATEVGRQPWVVYGLLRTRDGISVSVPAGQVLASLLLFASIYFLLFWVWIYLLRREIRKGPPEETMPKEGAMA
jgi:cytochrome d ubiquinol oxidase subunit I